MCRWSSWVRISERISTGRSSSFSLDIRVDIEQAVLEIQILVMFRSFGCSRYQTMGGGHFWGNRYATVFALRMYTFPVSVAGTTIKVEYCANQSIRYTRACSVDLITMVAIVFENNRPRFVLR